MMLGLAIGSRLPSAVMLLPFTVYLVRDDRSDELRDFFVWTIVIPMLAFLPIIWTYGPDFLNFYDAQIGVRTVIRLLAKDAVGLIGALAIGLGVLVSLPRLAKLPRDFVKRQAGDDVGAGHRAASRSSSAGCRTRRRTSSRCSRSRSC